MTVRLSMSSFAGTARTLVAVGTVRLASIFATTRAAAPLRTVGSVGVAGEAAVMGAGAGAGTGAGAGVGAGAGAAEGGGAMAPLATACA